MRTPITPKENSMTSNVPVPDVVKADPKRPYKAYASTALAALSTFVAYWIADEAPFTAKEIGQGILLALIGSGITGGATFAVKNPKTLGTPRSARRSDLGYGAIELVVVVILIVILVAVLLRVL